MVADSYDVLVKQFTNGCGIAVKNTANRLLQELQKYIQVDYYDMYEPLYYTPRTYKFLNSAIAKMVGQTTASIGIDDAFFDYEYPARYRLLGSNNQPSGENGHWTGEDQVYMADAGYHGNVNIYRDGHFFKDFLDYCNENAIPILKEELRKQKIEIE